jgi:MFS superfamily sulfate permease-like transporter
MNMVDTTVVLVVANTVLSGIAAGTGLDVSIRQLPARHRIGVLAYSAYSKATDLGTALLWYPILGIVAPLLAFATAVVAFFQHVPLVHAIPIYVATFLWVVHLLLTLIWAVPTLTRQRQVATDDEKRLAVIFNSFERVQTPRTINGVLIFGIMLWALVSYIN